MSVSEPNNERLFIDGGPIHGSATFELEITPPNRSDEIYECSILRQAGKATDQVIIHSINGLSVNGDPVVFAGVTGEAGREELMPNRVETEEKIAIVTPPSNFIILGTLKAFRIRNGRSKK